MCHHPLRNRSLSAAWGLRVEDTAPLCPRLHPTKLTAMSSVTGHWAQTQGSPSSVTGGSHSPCQSLAWLLSLSLR